MFHKFNELHLHDSTCIYKHSVYILYHMPMFLVPNRTSRSMTLFFVQMSNTWELMRGCEMAHHGHVWKCTHNYATIMSRLNMSWCTTAVWNASSKPAIHFLAWQHLKKRAMLTKHHYYTVYSCSLFCFFSSTIPLI